MESKISKELAYFLKKNGIYTNFMKYNRNSELPQITLHSFDWMSTSEGYAFWDCVYGEYFTYLTRKMTKLLNEKYQQLNN